ncbi:GMC oxidoreductase [Pseudomonas sp. REB1044]|uniref:GMC oxidoreductase n=1 Tax=Pseudomonas sp. REB1044 TaxID=2675224 RepID=UPI00315CC6D3
MCDRSAQRPNPLRRRRRRGCASAATQREGEGACAVGGDGSFIRSGSVSASPGHLPPSYLDRTGVNPGTPPPVANAQARVSGLEGLSVVDASILSDVPSVATTITVIAPAEKIAALYEGKE